jgi:ADP-ribosylglycohydrolase
LLWEQQDDGLYFYDPSNLQMSINLTGVSIEEIIRRFKNGPGPGPGPVQDFKHPLSKVRPRRVDIRPFPQLFYSNAPTIVNNTQLEAAVVLNMIECVENMIECLEKKLGTMWRGEYGYTFKNLYTDSLDRLTKPSFSKRFESYHEYTYCQMRIANFHKNVTTVLRNNNGSAKKIAALRSIVGNLNMYLEIVCAAAADAASTTPPVPDPIAAAAAAADAAAKKAKADATATQPKPNFVSIRETRARHNKELLNEAIEDSKLFDKSDYSEDEIDEMDDEGDVISSFSASVTPTVSRQTNVLGSLDAARRARINRFTSTAQHKSKKEESMKTFRLRVNEGVSRAVSGGKKTKSKSKRKAKGKSKNKNLKKTKRRAANKKNKKAQQHAGRVSRHNKVFRRKTRKSK